MWAIGVIAAVIGATVIARFVRVRDNVPPMERHLRALDALRDLSEHPRPPADLVVQPESKTDHVRILEETASGVGTARRSSRRASATWPADRGRRPVKSRSAKSATRPGSDLPTLLIRPLGESHPLVAAAGIVELRPEPRSDPEPRAEHRPEHRPERPALRMSVPRRVYAGVGVLAAVVVVGIAIVVGTGSGAHTPARVAMVVPRSAARPATAARVPAVLPTTAARAVPLVARTADGASVTVTRPFRLSLHATGTCWVDVTDASGATLFTATMRAGEDRDIPDAQTVTVRIGYTPALTLSVDGVAIDLGQLAQTANVDFRTT